MSSNNTETKWQIHMIFIYYTSYADRNNFRLLKQQNYRRFLIDSETVMKEASFVHYDIAFQKINHTAILFGELLNLIPDIAGNFWTYHRNFVQKDFKSIGIQKIFKKTDKTLIWVNCEQKWFWTRYKGHNEQ